MPPLYPVAGHPLLEGDAVALGSEALSELTMVAERVLGLRGGGAVVLTGDEAAEVTRAVALQVSLAAAQDPESFLLTSVGRGSETMDYRDGVLVHPTAQQIVDAVFADLEAEAGGDEPAWPVLGGWRTSGNAAAWGARAERYNASPLNAARNRGLG